MAVVFLGFDAGNPRLIDELVSDGRLPNFARVTRDGRRAPITNEAGLYIGGVWPTYLSGVGTDRHGFYTGIRPEPHGYDYMREGVNASPFWAAVAEAGRSVTVVDAPFFPVQPELGITQLVEWGSHDRYVGTSSSPGNLIDEAISEVGHHRFGLLDRDSDFFAPCDWMHRAGLFRTTDETRAFIAEIADAIELRRRMAAHIHRAWPADLVVHVAAESHCAQHHLWHLHDQSHVRHDGATVEAVGGDPLPATFDALDGVLGEHLAALGPDDTIYVLLSHGMQNHYDGTYILDDVLRRLEICRLGAPTPWLGPRAHTARAIVERLPRAARTRLVPLTGRVAHAVIGGRPHDPTHWMERPHPSERLWWRIENNTESGALRFNVVGRERDGKVEPHDLRAHEDWLDQQLLQIVNVDSGERLIRRVFRTAELYRRRPDDGLPDMIIEWNRDTPIERIWSPLIGQICRPDTNWRSGEHSPHGTLICVGPGVVPGVQGEIRPTDVAPTVARAFGVDLPGVDGHAIETLVPSAPAVPARANAAVATPPVLSDRILATSAWIRQARLATDPLVSVILPTLDRRDRLPRAAQSVLTQRYQNLELVVVDDGSRDGTADWLAGVEDPRLVVARSSKPRGEGGARNAGLERATGELIAFLDDDNAFDPDWLRSVVWFFERQPDASVVYGARVIDGAPPGEPHLQLNKWTPIGTRWNSLVDMNVIAHRRCGVRFDADLDLCADWDYLNRLTIGRDVVAHQLPVIATYYSTDAPGRRSDVDAARWDAIHSLMHARWGAPVGG